MKLGARLGWLSMWLACLAGCAGAPSEPGDVPPRAPPPGAPDWLPDGAAVPGDPGPSAFVGAPESPLYASMVPSPTLAQPSLAPARELASKGKRGDAARWVGERAAEAEAKLAANAADAAKLEVARLNLAAATLHRDGGNPDQAAEAYGRAARLAPFIAPAAHVEIAAIRLRQGKAAEALAALDAIEPAERTNAEWLPVHAEASIRAGDAEAGARELEAYLARPRRAGAASVGLRALSALVAKPGVSRAEAAARIARTLVGLASGSVAAEAHALEKRALDALPRDRRARLAGSPLEQKVEAARAKLRSKDARAAVTLLDRIAKNEGKKTSRGEGPCALHRVRGEALGEVKRKAEAADAYGLALDACVGVADRVELLFAAAKASARAERAAEAESRYARVEAESPKHRLADDARAARVQAAIERGDLATATSLAESAVATFPAGDVVFDAPFAVAQAHMIEGRWDRARAVLEATAKDATRERSYLRAGRFDYYVGRARESARDAAGARSAYSDLVRRRPATFYGALAFARLEEMERGAGAMALATAKKRAMQSAPLPEPTEAELSSSALRRAIELAVAGDAASAEAELDGRAEMAKPPSPGLRWWTARLVAPAEPVRASSILRGISEVEATPGDVDFDAWLDVGPFGPALPAWQIAYPRPFSVEVATAATESGVGEPLLLSIMREESAFSPTAVSRTGARGLLQLMPATAKKMATPLSLPHDKEALERPEINTRLGARFLGQLRKRFPSEPLLAVPSYNAGPLATERWCEERPTLDFDLWVETIPYRETRLYTKRVLASLAAYDLLGPGPRGEVFFTSRNACGTSSVGEGGPTREDAPGSDPAAEP